MAANFQQDEDDEIDPTKMLLLDVQNDDKICFTVHERVPTQQVEQHHHLSSIGSTVLIRQLPSQGLSFQLWPAATTLVTLLDNYRRDPSASPFNHIFPTFPDGSDPSEKLNIIELGSGTGLVGIAAAVTLAANVTLTDLPHVIPNLEFNAEANSEVVQKWGGKVNVAPLSWGEADDVERLGRGFDLVIASDVVYHDNLYDPLLKTLSLMLLEGESKEKKKSKMVFVMAHLRRWKKESVFFKKAKKLFDVRVLHVDRPLEGSRTGVVVYSFTGKGLNQSGGLENQTE